MCQLGKIGYDCSTVGIYSQWWLDSHSRYGEHCSFSNRIYAPSLTAFALAAERPAWYTEVTELLWNQPPPADCHAGLQGPSQGKQHNAHSALGTKVFVAQEQGTSFLLFPSPFHSLKDYLDALVGICYDGVEGLLYLALFSLMAAVSFSTIICAMPQAWKHLASR